MTQVASQKSDLDQQMSQRTGRLVLKFQPFRALTTEMVKEAVSFLRFLDDSVGREEVTSVRSLSLSMRELVALIRIDQLLAALDKLDRMERHYLEVSKLDAEEVQKRVKEGDPDDAGALAYKWCLVDGSDPRVKIAQRILALIPIARRRLEEGKQAFELDEILTLNEQANMLLVAPHAHRGLNNLLAGRREGGRRRNPGGKSERETLALDFLEAVKANPQLTQQEFMASQVSSASVRTSRRGLEDLRSSAKSGEIE